ncbi:N-acetylmuramoyl-L-alanine amidase A [Poriferisphaera corsica]|uniref:N-acetylmuramoyl-L-alanine amidase n=1 Tax=Poriferisphaera corsica TaxID=2528020 RepID=A0A517YP58_9BACT|nr:peptidoglycan recognition family protein [Poriferisphaera corsica]QDU32008.1 N-acetylmuramoyl-L-alanine amidase A [Poriferisphaera corsica]
MRITLMRCVLLLCVSIVFGMEQARGFEEAGSDFADLQQILNKGWQEFEFKGAKNASNRWGTKVDSIVMHTTEGSGVYENTVRWFRNSGNNSNSAHFVIARDGRVTQMVDSTRRAWHGTYYNRRSIGIEMSGFSRGHVDPNDDRVDTWRYEVGEPEDVHDPTPGDGYRSNLDTLADVVAYYVQRYDIPLIHPEGEAAWHKENGEVVRDIDFNQAGLVGHGQVQPWNRRDPGAMFPWEELISRVESRIPEPSVGILMLLGGLGLLRRK